jgi:hypothetical protein
VQAGEHWLLHPPPPPEQPPSQLSLSLLSLVQATVASAQMANVCIRPNRAILCTMSSRGAMLIYQYCYLVFSRLQKKSSRVPTQRGARADADRYLR